MFAWVPTKTVAVFGGNGLQRSSHAHFLVFSYSKKELKDAVAA
jgi:hypothetical protein